MEKTIFKHATVRNMNPPIRILIADDHTNFRETLSQLLDLEDDFTVVGKAADGEEVIDMARTLQPDIILMDFDMPKVNGIEATKEIRRSRPAIPIIGYSMHGGCEIMTAMLDAGATAHVPKNSDRSDLLSAIRKHAKR